MNVDRTEQIPVPGQGVSWRLLTEADQPGLLQLIEKIEEADNPPYRTTQGEVRAWLSDTTLWRGIVGFPSEGPLSGLPVSYAHVTVFPNAARECLLKGGVDPAYRQRGIGEQLLTWQTREGRTLYRECLGDAPGHLITSIDPGQQAFEDRLKRSGYTWTRTTHELRRDLREIPAGPDIGSYHQIQPWTPELDDQAWRLYNRILEQNSHSYRSRKEWLEQREFFSPEWSFVAVSQTGDRPQVEGFIITAAYQQDWEVLGWKEGYIDLLGVADGAVRVDLSRALVTASMAAQKAGGMDQVATGIGTPANSQAMVLYQDLGFAESFETRTYSLKV